MATAGKTLSGSPCCSVPTQCGRGTRDKVPWVHGSTGRWYDVIKPILIDIQHPGLSDPCQLLPVSRRPIEDFRGCKVRTYK